MVTSSQREHFFILFNDLGLGGVQRKMVDFVNRLRRGDTARFVVPHLVLRERCAFSFEKELPLHFPFIHYLTDDERVPQPANCCVTNPKNDPHLQGVNSGRFCGQSLALDGFLNTLVKYIVSPSCETNSDNNGILGRGRFRFPAYLARLILRYRPAVLFSFSHQMTIVAILLKKILGRSDLRIVVGQDNLLSYENDIRFTRRTYPPLLIRQAFLRTDRIITVSRAIKNELVLRFGIPNDKIAVIQNWVQETEKLSKPKRYDLIYLGRLSAQKNLAILLEVLALICRSRPQTSLCLVGSGEERSRLQGIVTREGLSDNVVILEPRIGVAEILASAKLFLLTSHFEGHPISLLEAMVQELVPVVLAYKGAEEQIVHGRSGFIERDPPSMAERIESLLGNDRKRIAIGRQARAIVLAKNGQVQIDRHLSEVFGRRVVFPASTAAMDGQ